jgi:hypothetical protein
MTDFSPDLNAITNLLAPGRLGDQLMAYAGAKWLSHKYQIPLLYRSFPLSDKFNFHFNEKLPVDKYIHHYTEHVKIIRTTQLCKSSPTPVLYLAPFNIRNVGLDDLDGMGKCAALDIEYQKIMTFMFTSKVLINKLNKLPDNIITVALHVRKGNYKDRPTCSRQLFDTQSYFLLPIRKISPAAVNVDTFMSDERYPHKFPPDQFYIDQLRLLSDLLDDRPLYVYIFTDYNSPQDIANSYTQELQKSNISFAFHSIDMGVIDDFYNMAHFDCLVRPSSNFSRASQLLGNHKVVMYVQKAEWHLDADVVVEVGIIIKNTNEFFTHETYKKTHSTDLKKAVNDALKKA